MVKNELSNPIVAIRCITYNHELYIRDALEGFVMQKTTFPFVAIVHDDASTDNTANIIREYAKKYPDIIKPIFETENQYSKKDGSLSKIIREASERTGAKYYAECEGDDYWTDPLKLQKQVDFLESHPDYSMCFHKVRVIGISAKKQDNAFQFVESKDYTPKELLGNWLVQTASIVMRKNIVSNIPRNDNFCVGDNVLLATCITNGKIYGFEDTMAVYRRTVEGWTLRNRQDDQSIIKMNEKLIIHYKTLNLYFPSLKEYYDQRIIGFLSHNILYYVKKDKRKSWILFRDAYSEYHMQIVKKILSNVSQFIINKIRNI